MELLYPNFLWALLAISIPIAIHLFNFRKYTTLLYSDVSILKNVKEKTQKQRNLKHLLVLLMRILATIFLVLAFAQPFIPAGESDTDSKVLIVLDNSPSLLAIDKNGENLNYAKLKAKEIVNTYSNNVLFRLTTHNQSPKHSILLTKAEVLQEIDALSVAFNSVDIASLVKVAESNETFQRTFIVSDFQKSNLEIQRLDTTHKISFVALPTQSLTENIGIDSIWLDNPIALKEFNQKINVLVHNYGSSPASNVSVTLSVNDEASGAFTVDVPAESKTKVEFTYTPSAMGVLKGKISLTGPKLRFDDDRYFALNIASKRTVAIISESQLNPKLSKVFKDDFVELKTMASSNLNLDDLAKADVIVLDHLKELSPQIIEAIQNNTEANVLIIPSFEADVKSYQSLKQLDVRSYEKRIESCVQITDINTEDPYFYSAFGKDPKRIKLAGLESYFKISGASSGFILAQLNSGDPLALRLQNKTRNTVLLAAGLTDEFGSWYNSRFIYPLLYQSVLYKSQVETSSYNTNKLGRYSLSHQGDLERPVKVLFEGKEFIPQQKLFQRRIEVLLDDKFRQKGFYNIVDQQDTVGLVAMNIPVMESDIQFYSNKDLELAQSWQYLDGEIATLRTSVSNLINGINYWKQCLLLALLFFLFEVLILRFAKSI